MRPGHFCPGNDLIFGEGADAAAGFNEAGAFLPRKLRDLPPARLEDAELQ